MQFVANGPDIPDELLQAHEEGNAIFFCGAGISYPAGLPGFGRLVDQIYQLIGTTREPNEQAAFDRSQFDATLDLLERRLPGQRLALRGAVAQALKPKLRREGATETHAAMLRLARSREGRLRLVTTNFDRLFQCAAKRTKQGFKAYSAPTLPIPKNSRWDGLVYLHGLLPVKTDETVLNSLVLTSGDFGLAYLTERWAARFVSELFRNYEVCFVGYSINDPVLRYMMDALAADRMLGETTPWAWALADCEPGNEPNKIAEWGSKGVTPILYDAFPGRLGHSALHRTLHAWAATYRDGVMAKERIVVSYALTGPSTSTRQDDFVGRMLWALSDKSGLPAKRFAELDPAPSLEWLFEAFSDRRFQHKDLCRFGVPPHKAINADLRFSFVDRRSPYDLAPPMRLVFGGLESPKLDPVMFHLARWLVRHLNDPKLVLWLAQQGGQLHDRLVWLIDLELDEFARLEREGKDSALEDVRRRAPNAIPTPAMRILWRLLLTGCIKPVSDKLDFFRWLNRLKREGFSTSLRLELRELLAPKVTLRSPYREDQDPDRSDELVEIRQLVDWEIVLSADNIQGSLSGLTNEGWNLALPELLPDLQQLLRDALDLKRELDDADHRRDGSFWDLPSISSHWQNRGFRDWVVLIELLRDSWLSVRSADPGRATQIAQEWFDQPYPTFKRLALFAASQEGCIAPERWVDWLQNDSAWWLWSLETKREALRLLVLQGCQLTRAGQERLEAAILSGPPRGMYPDDLEPEDWQDLVDLSIWLRLAKLNESGVALGATAAASLEDLSRAHPKRQLATNERDEFSHWMSGTGEPDFEDFRDIDVAPRKRNELVRWLKRPPPERRPFYEDTWHDVCFSRFFHCALALRDLALDGMWPSRRWGEALQVWSREGVVSRSWRCAAPLVQTMPDEVILEIAHSVAWWLETASKGISWHEKILLNLCRRILALPIDRSSGWERNGEPIDQPLMEAINHPIGLVTQALLNLWFRREPNDNDLLPADIEPSFTQLCDSRIDRFRHGRVLLASRVIPLFRVDRPWTVIHMLPLFDWSVNQGEAKAAWVGFLWSPRLYWPLLTELKSQFLETARHYGDLGELATQYAAILTYAALDTIDGFTTEDFRSAIGKLPQEGLEVSAQALSQTQEGAGNQREEYWNNRVKPFWQGIWPKSREFASSSIAESLFRLSVAAGDEFPAALAVFKDWLCPIEHPHYVVQRLHESGLCRKCPADAMQLLSAIIGDQTWAPRELGQCIEAIREAAPALEQDHRFQRLEQYSRKHGM